MSEATKVNGVVEANRVAEAQKAAEAKEKAAQEAQKKADKEKADKVSAAMAAAKELDDFIEEYIDGLEDRKDSEKVSIPGRNITVTVQGELPEGAEKSDFVILALRNDKCAFSIVRKGRNRVGKNTADTTTKGKRSGQMTARLFDLAINDDEE